MKTEFPSAFSLQLLALPLLAALALFATSLPVPAQTGWGSALSLDGVDDYVSVPAGPWFGEEFTFETWVYPRAHTLYARIVSFTTEGSPNGLANSVSVCMSEQETGKPSLHIFNAAGGDSWLVSPQSLPLNQWSHVAVTLKAGNAVIYINGLAVINGPVTANPVTRTINYIGKSTWSGAPPDPTLNAMLDDLRIWSVAQTAAQIEQAMWHPLTGAELGLLAYYRFNEGAGNIVHDATAHHLDAAFVNTPTWVEPAVPVPTRPGDQTIDQGTSATVQFTLTDMRWENVAVTVTSENPVLLPNTGGAIILSGSDAFRTLTLVPVPEHSGAAPVKLTVSDGVSTLSYRFTLNVRPRLDSPLLRLTDVTPLAPQTVRLRFRDDGTGSTNYVVEFRSDLSPTNIWIPLANLAQGVVQADVTRPPGNQGYFRIAGLRAFTASFDSSGAKVDEGTGTLTPVVVFNGPFQGTVRYTVTGTLGTNDYTTLTGQVQINGTTAVIPIQLTDNQSLNQLRYITLRLELGQGYQLGTTRQSTFFVEDNDADWQGQLQMPGGPLASASTQIVYRTNNVSRTNSAVVPLNNTTSIDFLLRIQRSGNNLAGTVASAGSGFFPPQGVPAQLSVNADAFSAVADPILLSADTTPFNSPVWLALQLMARNGQAQETNTSTRVAGSASLVVRYEGLPHLDTTNLGTFLLIKPPAKPCTNEVRLVTAP